MPNMKNDKTTTYLEKLKKHPVVVSLIIFASAVVFLGTFTESLDKLATFYDKYFSDEDRETGEIITTLSTIPKEQKPPTKGQVHIGQERVSFDWIEQLRVDEIEALFESHSIVPKSRHNESPTALEFLSFIQKHPNIYAHGYKETYKDHIEITLTGLIVLPQYCNTENKLAVLEFCSSSSDIDIGERIYCVWD